MEVKHFINDEIRGLCLFLGFAGLAYVAFLILLAALTSFKIVKGLSLLVVLSVGLITLGFTPQLRNRLFHYVRSHFLT